MMSASEQQRSLLGDGKPSNFTMKTAVKRRQKKKPISQLFLLVIMVGLICLGTCNFVALKIMYKAYGNVTVIVNGTQTSNNFAFFASQGVNLLYLVYAIALLPNCKGGMVLYPLMCFTDQVPPEQRSAPGVHRKFVIMAFLDCWGTFLTAMGNVYTPGQWQPVLNQTLIPLTMTASYFYLRRHFGSGEIAGAMMIIFGACFSVIPGLIVPHSQADARWYSVLLYFGSNIPMACSAVYKEASFAKTSIHVYYLTQWVSLWQLLIGFVLMPLQVLPGFGTRDGMPFQELVSNFYGGLQCYVETESSGCAGRNTFWLLTGYTGLNFLFNTLGLYLTKHGSAVLNGFSYAVLLPLTTVAFSFLPMPYREQITPYTIVGMVCVLCGFVVYQHFSASVKGGSSNGREKTTTRKSGEKGRLVLGPGDSEYGTLSTSDGGEDSFDDDGELRRAEAASPATDICGSLVAAEEGADAMASSSVAQSSFQERVIGMGMAWRRAMSPEPARTDDSV